MSDTEKIHRWLSQAELDRMLDQAYRRGAEAMRDKAAQYLEDDSEGESMHMSIAAEIYAGVIRALPIPEDKP